MTELENFGAPEELDELNREMSALDSSGEVSAAIERVVDLSSLWVSISRSEPTDEENLESFEVRDDLKEARLALRRVCR